MDITVLNLSGTGAFAEYFLLLPWKQFLRSCKRSAKPSKSGLTTPALLLAHREGKPGAEWVLLDYGSFVVHIFSQRAREYYDLERLWRTAERFTFSTPENSSHLPTDSESDPISQ